MSKNLDCETYEEVLICVKEEKNLMNTIDRRRNTLRQFCEKFTFNENFNDSKENTNCFITRMKYNLVDIESYRKCKSKKYCRDT